jgi:hypothetical protein
VDKDYAEMSDEELMAEVEAEATAEAEAAPVEQDNAADAGAIDAEPPAEQEQQEQPTQQQAEDWNPDGPGDIKAALRQEREQARALKQQLAELQQWRQQQEQAAYQAQAQAEEAQRQAERRAQLENTFDPDDQERLYHQWRNEDAQRIQYQAQQAHVQALYQQGFEIGREAFPDFDTVLNRGLADPELAPVLEAVAQRAIAEGKNPTIAAYKTAKRLDPVSAEERIKAEVQKQVQSVLQKRQPPANRGHDTIGHVSAQPVGAAPRKAIQEMSTEELERDVGLY